MTSPLGVLEAGGPPAAALERPDFQIVPRAGLPIVALVLALLIAAIAVNKLWPLEFFHVVGGAAWTVIDLFLGFILGPIIGRMSIPARIEFTTRLMPKMVLLMPTVVTVTLAAGWQLGTHLGTVQSSYALHGWVVASFIVVGVMAVDRPWAAGAGEHRGADRAEEAAAEPRGDRAADEALHLHGGRDRSDAGGDARDHDQAGVGMSEPAPGIVAERDPADAVSLPPVTQVGMLSLALIVARRHLPVRAPARTRAADARDRAAGRIGALLAGNLAALARVTGFAWAALLRGRQVGAAGLRVYRGDDRVRVPAQPHQRRAADRADACAGRLRRARARADRLHRRALRTSRKPLVELARSGLPRPNAAIIELPLIGRCRGSFQSDGREGDPAREPRVRGARADRPLRRHHRARRGLAERRAPGRCSA